MEVLNIYGIFDKKALTFDQPFFAPTDLYAERRFRLMQKETPSVLNHWTGEFQLVKLGKVNIITGAVEPEFVEILDGKAILAENGETAEADQAVQRAVGSVLSGSGRKDEY